MKKRATTGISTNRSALSRRQFLRGAGVALALPLRHAGHGEAAGPQQADAPAGHARHAAGDGHQG